MDVLTANINDVGITSLRDQDCDSAMLEVRHGDVAGVHSRWRLDTHNPEPVKQRVTSTLVFRLLLEMLRAAGCYRVKQVPEL